MESLESRYEIKQTLTGGQSIIYKARDKVLDRLVAIKVPNETVMSDEHKLEKFIEEGRKMARLKDENVLTVLHFEEQNDSDEKCYLVTEWMDQTLEQALQREDLDINAATMILGHILKGLHALHNAGIVHRDLKPSNIYLSTDGGDVRIGDLGIASDVGEDETLTATPKYIAPEIYRTEGEVDRRSDLYSLGVLAYEMFLGRQRFESAFADIYNTDSDKTRNARWLNWHLDPDRKAPALKDLVPEIPEKHSGIVQRMMAKDPDDRFSSADEVLREFGEIQDSSTVSFKPLPIPGQTVGKDAQKSWKSFLQLKWITLFTVLLLAIIIAIVYPYSSGDIDLANKAGAEMKTAYDKAIAAGAKEPPVIYELEQGEKLRVSGIDSYEKRAYDLALVDFVKARKLFEESTELAWQRRVGKARTLSETNRKLAVEAKAGDPDPVDTFAEAASLVSKAVSAFGKKRYGAAETGYLKASELFDMAREQGLLRQLELARSTARAARDSVPPAERPSLEKYSANFKAAEAAWAAAEQFFEKNDFLQAIANYDKAATGYAAAVSEIPVLHAWQRMQSARQAALDIGIKQSDPNFAAAEQVKLSGQKAYKTGDFILAEHSFNKAMAGYQSLLGTVNKTTPQKNATIMLGSSEQEIDAAMTLCQRYSRTCKRKWYATEKLREAQLKPYIIDATEVTNREFAEFVAATGHTTSAEAKETSRHWLQGASVNVKGYNWKTPLGKDTSYQEMPNHPVVHVSQTDAIAYCQWRGQRLPTEDEWEFAARGKQHRIFPWGNEWRSDSAVWKARKMSPVKQLAEGATAEGIYDLAGNVWEWTTTTEGDKIVLKGGSWSEANPANLRAAARRIENPGTTHSDDGFRCVRDTQSWSERE